MNRPQIIPKIIHRAWLGSKPMPEDAKRFLALQEKTCRDYEHLFWNEEVAKELYPVMLSTSVKMLEDSRIQPVGKSDILRHELLRLFGGIWVDTDIEILRPFDELLDCSFFCAYESVTAVQVGTAILGCVPFHPLTNAMLTAIADNYAKDGPPTKPMQQMSFGGPFLFTRLVNNFPDVTILERRILYPFNKPRLPAALHHFAGGTTKEGWTNQLRKNDPKNTTPDLAGQRPDTGKAVIFFGRNHQVLRAPGN